MRVFVAAFLGIAAMAAVSAQAAPISVNAARVRARPSLPQSRRHDCYREDRR
jgi:hypothetical protein